MLKNLTCETVIGIYNYYEFEFLIYNFNVEINTL